MYCIMICTLEKKVIMEEVKEQKKLSTGRELVRFIVTGILCALVDFASSYGVLAILNKCGIYGFLATALSTPVGFIIGVILNYILSTYWVFKNTKDKAKTKTFKFILAFVLLSAVAWGLSVGTMELCALTCRMAWGIEISSGADAIIQKIVTFTFWGDVTFWCYFGAFCLRTLVGLVWNYFTRKYILYK